MLPHGQGEMLKVAILLNRLANQGRAAQKWNAIAPLVRQQLADKASTLEVLDTSEALNQVPLLIESGYQMLIAAGGDGSVHFLLQEMMKHRREGLLLGAVGLGSSNDFHKPFTQFIRGIPVRIDPVQAKKQDVGCMRYTDEAGTTQTRYFLINASIGVTANANWLFNHPDAVLRRLKGRFVPLAILYAAIKTILRHRNFKLRLESDQFCCFGRFANVAMLKSAHVSGSLTYDQHLLSDDGLLGLNICEEMSRSQLLRVLADLSRSVFSGKAGRFSAYIRQLHIDTMGQQLPLEMDGEVVLASDIHCSILPGALSVVQTLPKSAEWTGCEGGKRGEKSLLTQYDPVAKKA